mmetsp:Transcript_123258/g.349260  ORF Transcript_123258/g.349260 Transcript_123258/m.349260 type:complete len:88 (-) Transcript_123258:78-341(-)
MMVLTGPTFLPHQFAASPAALSAVSAKSGLAGKALQLALLSADTVPALGACGSTGRAEFTALMLLSHHVAKSLFLLVKSGRAPLPSA